MNLMNLLSKPVAIGVNIRGEERKKMDTFVTNFHDQFSTLSFNFSNHTTRHQRQRRQQQQQQQLLLQQQQQQNHNQLYCQNDETISGENHCNNCNNNRYPIPTLPPIESSTKRGRVDPLTIEEYENNFRESATDFELIERVFFGSMSCNQLRAALWPYLFGLIEHRGKFEKIYQADGRSKYIFVEHEANASRWRELQKLYYKYQAQWRSIMPDQEQRFSTYRERKSLIERDVIRCDRLHKFYANEPQNLATLTNLLMTYMMYDFDIGYVQGMSDLAGPILYMYNGDLVKSFWIFVEVMKLFRRNFEMTQKTIHFQLNCLHELIKITDPVFAQYLEENESSNCFFAFKAIVCQFKRELKKEDEDDYSRVLFLWDTIWCANRRRVLQEEYQALIQADIQQVKLRNKNYLDIESNHNSSSPPNTNHNNTNGNSKEHSVKSPLNGQPNMTTTTTIQTTASSTTTTNGNNQFFVTFDQNQSDTPRHNLTETEIFVLALCLSMVRRERDIILANKLDGTDIHLHFINPKLSSNLNNFIEHAINIYSFMKNDFDLTRLTSPKSKHKSVIEQNPETPIGSPEGFDLLKDYDVIVNGVSGC